ncbi:MAG: hypothetical protein V1789_07585 [PVC group bacterium]
MKIVLFAAIFIVIGQADYIEVSPERLSKDPEEYIGVPIKFKCRFLKEDPTWLNDADVPRPAEKYVGFVVEAGGRIFAQLFFPRERAKDLKRFASKDRLIIYGTVFSARFDFPWIDVDKISEGWVIGEEPEQVKDERIKMAREYEDFLKARSRILEELELDDVRDIYSKQEALIELLRDKKIFTAEEFERYLSRQKVKPTPVPDWELILQREEQ